jgi:hypothetical protein
LAVLVEVEPLDGLRRRHSETVRDGSELRMELGREGSLMEL